MALANYTDLQSSIAAWAHRSDLTAIIPDFIALCIPLILGTFKNPAESPIKRPPGKVNFGIDCMPPSTKVRAP